MIRLDLGDEDDLGWYEAEPDTGVMAAVFRQSLRDEYAHASEDEVDGALSDVLRSMSPAESVDFAGALNQIGKGTGQLLSDPTISAIAQTALPVAGGVVGTAVGGPVGTVIGGALGTIAAGSLPAVGQALTANSTARPRKSRPVAMRKKPRHRPPAPAAAAAKTMPGRSVLPPPFNPGMAVPTSAVAAGSTAAAQGLVLTQQPDVLQGLLAASLGQLGRTEINGVPVTQILAMLSEVIGQAAADADELMYLDHNDGTSFDDAGEDEPWNGDSNRPLYKLLLDADNADLAEAMDGNGVEFW